MIWGLTIGCGLGSSSLIAFGLGKIPFHPVPVTVLPPVPAEPFEPIVAVLPGGHPIDREPSYPRYDRIEKKIVYEQAHQEDEEIMALIAAFLEIT